MNTSFELPPPFDSPYPEDNIFNNLNSLDASIDTSTYPTNTSIFNKLYSTNLDCALSSQSLSIGATNTNAITIGKTVSTSTTLTTTIKGTSVDVENLITCPNLGVKAGQTLNIGTINAITLNIGRSGITTNILGTLKTNSFTYPATAPTSINSFLIANTLTTSAWQNYYLWDTASIANYIYGNKSCFGSGTTPIQWNTTTNNTTPSYNTAGYVSLTDNTKASEIGNIYFQTTGQMNNWEIRAKVFMDSVSAGGIYFLCNLTSTPSATTTADNNNGISIFLDKSGPTLKIAQSPNGTIIQDASKCIAFNSNTWRSIRIRKIGTTISVWYNNTNGSNDPLSCAGVIYISTPIVNNTGQFFGVGAQTSVASFNAIAYYEMRYWN
jgi:hypothetical protein